MKLSRLFLFSLLLPLACFSGKSSSVEQGGKICSRSVIQDPPPGATLVGVPFKVVDNGKVLDEGVVSVIAGEVTPATVSVGRDSGEKIVVSVVAKQDHVGAVALRSLIGDGSADADALLAAPPALASDIVKGSGKYVGVTVQFGAPTVSPNQNSGCQCSGCVNSCCIRSPGVCCVCCGPSGCVWCNQCR